MGFSAGAVPSSSKASSWSWVTNRVVWPVWSWNSRNGVEYKQAKLWTPGDLLDAIERESGRGFPTAPSA